MSRWFRHYAGMMRDEKLVRVAIKSKQPIERVLWVWGAILESAAEIDENGRYDLDAAEVAYFLRADDADIFAILSALTDANRLDDDVVVNWGDRQFSSDKSKDRQAAYRERKRAEKRDSDGGEITDNDKVTPASRHADVTVTAQETETEKEVNTDVLTAKRRSVVARKPAEISDSLWGDWKRHRNAPFTETALKGFEREAALAGWTLEAAIMEAIERGWQGFKAEWVKEKQNGNNGRNQNNSSRNGKPADGFAAALRHVANGSPDEPFGDYR